MYVCLFLCLCVFCGTPVRESLVLCGMCVCWQGGAGCCVSYSDIAGPTSGFPHFTTLTHASPRAQCKNGAVLLASECVSEMDCTDAGGVPNRPNSLFGRECIINRRRLVPATFAAIMPAGSSNVVVVGIVAGAMLVIAVAVVLIVVRRRGRGTSLLPTVDPVSEEDEAPTVQIMPDLTVDPVECEESA